MATPRMIVCSTRAQWHDKIREPEYSGDIVVVVGQNIRGSRVSEIVDLRYVTKHGTQRDFEDEWMAHAEMSVIPNGNS